MVANSQVLLLCGQIPVTNVTKELRCQRFPWTSLMPNIYLNSPLLIHSVSYFLLSNIDLVGTFFYFIDVLLNC